MPDVTDLTGIGPAKAETLEEEGYESLEDIANADEAELSEIEGVGGDDRALEFIVEAENLLEEEEADSQEESEEGEEFDLTPSEVGEELEEDDEPEIEVVDESDESSESETNAEESESEPEEENPTYEVNISFANDDEFHTFHAAIMRHHEDVYTSNQPSADAMRKILDGLDGMESVTYELTEAELNTLHTAVKQTRTNYQGDNLISHMESLREVEDQVDEIRRAELF